MLLHKILPRFQFPIDFKGDIKLSGTTNGIEDAVGCYDSYLRRQLGKERELKQRTSKSKLIIAASPKDVLLASSKVCWRSNPGNLQFLELINQRKDEYNNAKTSKLDQLCISWDIVKSIQDDFGGRFLLRKRINEIEQDSSNSSGGRFDDPTTTDSYDDEEEMSSQDDDDDTNSEEEDDTANVLNIASWYIMSDDYCQQYVTKEPSKYCSKTDDAATANSRGGGGDVGVGKQSFADNTTRLNRDSNNSSLSKRI